MMDRRAFLGVFGLLTAPLASEAQQVGKVPRIGYLSISAFSAEAEKGRVGAFYQGLRELGYVEGKNILVEQRYAAGRLEKYLELAEELVRLKVGVLVAYGRGDVVQKVTGTIPIVMPLGADRLVASLARPGGNITGLSDQHGDTVTKRLDLLREVSPSMSRVAVLWNPASPVTLPQLKRLQAAAPALGMTLLSVEATGPDDIDRAFSVIRQERPGGLFLIAESVLGGGRLARRIAEFAVKSRLPTIGTIRQHGEDGFLLAYGANQEDLWRRAATYVDKILQGTRPGDLPIELASKWDLVINLKTAKALGLTIPPSLLLRADQVIE